MVVNSWTYYLNDHVYFRFIVSILSVVFFYIPLIIIYVKFSDKPNTPKWIAQLFKPFLYVMFLPVIVFPQKFLDKLDKGGFVDFYISTSGNVDRLVVLHTEQRGKAGWSYLLTYYDLSTGKQVDETKLIKSSWNSLFFNRINDSLALSISSKDSIYINFNAATLLTTQEYKQIYKEPLPYKEYNRFAYADDWKFYSISDHEGKYISKTEAESSPESVILLKPSLIEEHNPGASNKNIVWVAYQSDYVGTSSSLSSFISSSGKEIKRYKNSEFRVFGNELVGTYTTNKTTILFLTLGADYKEARGIKGFTLSAVVVDSKTGEVINEIFYF